MSLRDSEVLCLPIGDLHRMRSEFHDQYRKLFDDSTKRMRRTLLLKVKAQQICQEKEETLSIGSRSRHSFDPGNEKQEDLTDQLEFNAEENAQIKKEEIDYGLVATNLNKIDEVSVESSDKSEKQGSSQSCKSKHSEIGGSI